MHAEKTRLRGISSQVCDASQEIPNQTQPGIGQAAGFDQRALTATTPLRYAQLAP
jgi:hypothetical protein